MGRGSRFIGTAAGCILPPGPGWCQRAESAATETRLDATIRTVDLVPALATWALAASPDPHAIGAPGTPTEPLAPRILRIAPPGRTLRPDFAPPDAVVVAYTRAWPRTLDALVDALTDSTDVLLVHEDEHSARAARRWHARLAPEVAARVFPTDLPVTSPWVRDYGPLLVREGARVRWIDAGYDVARLADDALPTRLATRVGAAVEPYAPWIEGGAFISDGEGLCAASVEYFGRRGPALSDAAGMRTLQERLGCTVLALLPSLRSEPTRHADMIAQFVAPGVVLVGRMGTATSDALAFELAADTLELAARELGRPLQVVRVPARYHHDGTLRSYVNGLRLGDRFLLPAYGRGDALDEEARHAVEGALPGIEVVMVPAETTGALGGGIHCITLGLDGITGAGV